jgi:hypothetical protein
VFALIINDDVMIFDMIKSYGIYKKKETNLNGYLLVINIGDLIKYSVKNFKTDVTNLFNKTKNFIGGLKK